MANTPNRVIRISDELWQAARAAAEANGESITDAIRRGLRDYVAETEQMTPARRAR